MAVGVVVCAASGLGVGRDVATAALRAGVQLAVVSVVIVAVVRSLWLAAAFVEVMLAIAPMTSARRVTGERRALLVTAVPIAAAPRRCSASSSAPERSR